MKPPKYDFIYARRLGSILRAARENLGIEFHHIISEALKQQMSFSEQRLREIEADDSGETISSGEWYFLTRLLYESPDCATTGFHPKLQLNRVRAALEEKNYPFPVSAELEGKLAEAAHCCAE